MWPELLKSLRSGLVFNPLDELQKRATQYGEGIGNDLQAQRTQAKYASGHPESQRAHREMVTNSLMLALQTWKPIESVPAELLAKVNKTLPEKILAPAVANKKTGLFNTGLMHADAVPNLIRVGGVDPDLPQGWFTSHGRVVSSAQAYKIKKAELSPPVLAQIATRAQQSGKEAKLTSEDFRGKLTPNRGTRADAPITGALPGMSESDRVAAAKARQAKIWNALDSLSGRLVGDISGGKKGRDALDNVIPPPGKFADATHIATTPQGHIIGEITPRGADGLTDAQRAKNWDNRNRPEIAGVEAPHWGKFFSPHPQVAGYIQPANPIEAGKLSIRNEVSQTDVEKALPSKPGLTLLDSLVSPIAHRGEGRQLTAEDKRMAEFRQIDSAWNVSHAALQAIVKRAMDEPNIRRTELANALRGGPKPPKGEPSLLGAYDMPEYIPTVEAVKYAKQLPHQFKHEIAKAQKTGNLFYTGSPDNSQLLHRTPNSKAIDIEIAARRVLAQAQEGIFVPPHATPAEAAAILGHAEHPLRRINSEFMAALQAAMQAARFLHLKD